MAPLFSGVGRHWSKPINEYVEKCRPIAIEITCVNTKEG